MIIDASKAISSKNGRPYAVSTAVGDFLDMIEVGSFIDAEALIDTLGNSKGRVILDAMVNRQKGDRRFTIKKHDGILARVYRTA